ncbi:MAG: YraN family protein [Ancalomicrobiaceae bacterium]|nr:YraN family protein [Ancalomicrobiaceae bacterium]
MIALRSSDERRRRAERWGLSAEFRAAWSLRLKGFSIIARRFKSPRGEIDIVARRGRTIAFVEVKARASFEDALEAVTPRTRRRIEAAAADWSVRHPGYADFFWRYDIVVVVPRRWPKHVADAFRSGE